MSSIPQRLYNQVMMLDNFTCVYCGKRTPDVGIDHIIPRYVNGPDALHNLVACCPSCNARKRHHQLHEVGMRLRAGRFGHSLARPNHKRIDPPVDIPEPPAPHPVLLSWEERVAHAESLARERDDNGKYRFSANKIRDIVGGNGAKIKALVAEIRKQ